MADIFLSYKRTDRERVTPIVALLESSGWSVWWDTRTPANSRPSLRPILPGTMHEPPRRGSGSWVRDRIRHPGLGGASCSGLLVGLAIILPAVLWLSGLIGGPQTKVGTGQPVADRKATEAAKVETAKARPRPIEKTEGASQYVTAPILTQTPTPASAPQSLKEPVSRVRDLLAQAKGRIDSGDILGAREILQAAETATSGPMTFMLAETYDPTMLASWQTRGIVANPVLARALYQKARELGDARAQQRLDWLR